MTGIANRIWNGETCVILASGPSLTTDDVAYVRGKARVIVINTTYVLAPWADVLYAADAKVWRWYWKKGPQGYEDCTMRDFAGLKFSLTRPAENHPGVVVLRRGLPTGLSLNPLSLHTGGNGGYQAIGLAFHLGASRIILLGYDMQTGPRGEEHWHGDHPNSSRSPYDKFRGNFPTLVEPLKAAGVEVVNCTRRTALTAFPCRPLRDVLPETAGVAA
jgi:hypothetical protein